MNDPLRPRYLTVICALWLLWGTGTALKSTRDYLAARETLAQMEALAGQRGVKLPPDLTAALYVSLAIVLVGALGVLGAWFLLRLRGWARGLLVAANWGTVLLVSWFAYLAMQQRVLIEAIRMPFRFRSPSEYGLMDLDGDAALSAVLVFLKFMIAAIPFAYMARKLGQREVHDAILRQKMRDQVAAG